MISGLLICNFLSAVVPVKWDAIPESSLSPLCVKISLRKDFDTSPNDFLAVRDIARGLIQEGDVPEAFINSYKCFQQLYARKEFLACARTLESMKPLIPPSKKDPQTGVTDNPFRIVDWQNAIGNLRAMGNDYIGAVEAYASAQKIKADFESPFQLSRIEYFSPARSQAEMLALMGNQDEALAKLKESMQFYGAGCGHGVDGLYADSLRKEAVYRAACLPSKQAETKLLKYMRGGYRPAWSAIGGKHLSQTEFAKGDAMFMLGELYFKSGKKDLAKIVFRAVACEKTTMRAGMAESRLRSL